MNRLRQIINETILKEEKFHEINTEISFDFELHHDEWGHTKDRKWRHGSGNKIYDLDIVNLIEDSKDEIIYNIIDGKIKDGKRFIVSRISGDNLNIVIEPIKNYINQWNLIIITVMRKEDFTVSKNQLQIFV